MKAPGKAIKGSQTANIKGTPAINKSQLKKKGCLLILPAKGKISLLFCAVEALIWINAARVTNIKPKIVFAVAKIVLLNSTPICVLGRAVNVVKDNFWHKAAQVV